MTKTYCKVCGGTNVQIRVWYNPNTREMTGGNPDDETFCEDCDANERAPNPPLTTDFDEVENFGRCRYKDCVNALLIASEEEQVTCALCRDSLGLPALGAP